MHIQSIKQQWVKGNIFEGSTNTSMGLMIERRIIQSPKLAKRLKVSNQYNILEISIQSIHVIREKSTMGSISRQSGF